LPPSFQTDSTVGGPSAPSLVPPTPVTNGWLAASSTARAELPFAGAQPAEPLSPAATKTLCPCVAASWKSVFSAASSVGSVNGSHRPHESLTTCAVSSPTMAAKVS
jgi:hypothetical protein